LFESHISTHFPSVTGCWYLVNTKYLSFKILPDFPFASTFFLLSFHSAGRSAGEELSFLALVFPPNFPENQEKPNPTTQQHQHLNASHMLSIFSLGFETLFSASSLLLLSLPLLCFSGIIRLC